MTKPISWYARRYTDVYGFSLVPIEPMRKFPTVNDWGNLCKTDPEDASEFYDEHKDWNMGLALGPSRMCSLDIDCSESFQCIIDEFGIDPDELWKYPTIQGSDKGRRVMFRVPDGANLNYQKLNWRKEDDETRHYTVLELRSGCDGKQRQDVLPPSIHPDTKRPYKWIVQPPKTGTAWPTPPAWLLAMWTDWDKFKPQLQAACPWAPEPPEPKTKPKKPAGIDRKGGSVIDQFNDAHDLRSMLETYGYKRKGKSRYVSPHSTTGLPGVVLFKDERRCFIHHASDPLCSDDNGRPVNPFDLFCYYDHNNNPGDAVKAAAELLGLDRPERTTATKVATTETAKCTDVATTNKFSRGGYNLIEPLPFTTDKGKPLKHIENLREIVNRAGVTLRYNVIAKEEEVIIPGAAFSMDNQANAALAWLRSECSLFNFPTEQMDGMITYLADQNQYNPVAEWVRSKPWDGKPRMQSLYDTVISVDQDTNPSVLSLKETLIKRWMMSAIAAAFLPEGVSAGGVLVFQGEQYLGKTKWFKSLVPEELGLLKDGMLLRPDDKDSVKQVCSFWLVELGELDSTFKKSDIAALKAFITSSSDVLRRAYARKESHYARRTVFFGSVNPRSFLSDATGNRRYWTIECANLDHSHSIDMQQCWAEAYEMWKGGEGWFLTPDEMDALNASNEQFMWVDPIEEMLMSSLDWDADKSFWEWKQATDTLRECGMDRPSRADASVAGSIIGKLNGGERKKSNGRQVLLTPPKLAYQRPN